MDKPIITTGDEKVTLAPRRIIGTLTVRSERGISNFDERVGEACFAVHGEGHYVESIQIVKDVLGLYAILVVSAPIDLRINPYGRRKSDGPIQ